MRFQTSDIRSIQNPPCPPFMKGGTRIPPFVKGGLGGIFLHGLGVL